MSKPIHDIEALIDGLAQQRDELLLQIRLAGAEVRDEWLEVERKLEHLRAQLEAVRKEAKGVSKDIFAAVTLVADEIKSGYERIRERL
jgi:hypothetical protein